jgi:hypothetical protein
MSTSSTFLAPGQRYRGASASLWQSDLHLTILAVAQNIAGPTLVTYRGPEGSRITALAVELEVALVEGLIIPVTEDFTLLVS